MKLSYSGSTGVAIEDDDDVGGDIGLARPLLDS